MATSATILGLPCATSLSRKALSAGLWRLATSAPKYRAVRTLARPPPMKLLPRQRPDWRVQGASPGEGGDGAPVEGAELGQLGDKSAGDDGADTGHGGEEVLLLAPGRRAPHGSVDVAVEAVEFAGKRLQEPVDALAHPLRRAGAALALGGHHGDDLAPSRDELGEQAGLRVLERPDLRRGGLDEVRDHGGVDGVGLRPLAERAGKGADLGRVDDDDGQAGLGEARDHDGLEASGRLKPDRLGSHGAQPLDQRGDAFGVARDIEAVVRATNVHVEAILGNVDTDDGGDGVHCLPSLRKRASLAAQATVRVQWNGERGPMLTHGLGVPEGRRPHARHRHRHYTSVGAMRVTRGRLVIPGPRR